MTDLRAEERAIRERISEWLKTARAGDARAVTEFYAPDAKFMVPNIPIADGREQIFERWDKLLSSPKLSLNFGPTLIEVAGSGDMAYEVGTYSLSYEDAKEGPVNDRGKYVNTWKKRQGTWQVTTDILNSDLPLP
jgi:uncharacterized protein (TIGR02246 family)